jgi:hypothetical protein
MIWLIWLIDWLFDLIWFDWLIDWFDLIDWLIYYDLHIYFSICFLNYFRMFCERLGATSGAESGVSARISVAFVGGPRLKIHG